MSEPEYTEQQRAADDPTGMSEGFPVAVEPGSLDEAISLLTRVKALGGLPDILSQQVHAFLVKHG